MKQFIWKKSKDRGYTNSVRLLNASEKIKQYAKRKKELYYEALDKYLIVFKFKCYEKCRKDLIRSTMEKYINQNEHYSGDLTKVAIYFDKYVIHESAGRNKCSSENVFRLSM